jgi:hypothetical protein
LIMFSLNVSAAVSTLNAFPSAILALAFYP